MSKVSISHDGCHYADIDTMDRVLMSVCVGHAFDMFRSQGYTEWELEFISAGPVNEWAKFELTYITRFNDWRLVNLTTSSGVEFLFDNQTEVSHYVAVLCTDHIKQLKNITTRPPAEMGRVMSRDERKTKEKAANNTVSGSE